MTKLSLATFPTMREAYATFQSLTTEFKASFRRKETVEFYLSHLDLKSPAAELRMYFDGSPTQAGEAQWFINQINRQ